MTYCKRKLREINVEKHRACVTLVLLLLITLASTVACVKIVPVEAQSGSYIDIFTQRGGEGENQSSDIFGPQEIVQLYAAVVVNEEPVDGVLVTFAVTEPMPVSNGTAFYMTAATNASGVAETDFSLHSMGQDEAFGTWTAAATVDVAGMIMSDSLTFAVEWTVEVVSVRTVDANPPNYSGFPPSRSSWGETGWVGLDIALQNNLMNVQNVSISISLVDQLLTVVNYTQTDGFLLPPNGEVVYIFRNIGIPKYAVPGNASVLVDVFNEENVSLCPQASVSLQISIGNPAFPNFIDDSVVYAYVIPTVVTAGDLINGTVLIRNQGTVTLNDIIVDMQVDNTLISEQTIDSLEPYSYQFLSVLWNTTGLAEGTHIFSANATIFPEEADITDNNYSVPFNVTGPVAQMQVTFDQSGVGQDFRGTVVFVDSVGYSVAQLPVSFTWSVGSAHSFAFQTPLVVSANAEQYLWTSTTGLSTSENDTITASTSGNITGNYKTQYYLTVISSHDSPTPTSGWFDSGSTISASVMSPVSADSATQYVCSGWTGTGSVPASGMTASLNFTLTQPSSITWNWKTQSQVTPLKISLYLILLFFFGLGIIGALVLFLFAGIMRRRRRKKPPRPSYAIIVHPHI
jgi:hypothetical protein